MLSISLRYGNTLSLSPKFQVIFHQTQEPEINNFKKQVSVEISLKPFAIETAKPTDLCVLWGISNLI